MPGGVLYPGPLPAQRQRSVVADGIVDRGGHHLAAPGHGDHDSEQRQPGAEVGGPVYRVHDEARIRVRYGAHQAGIAGGGFLPDHGATGEQALQARGQPRLCLLVGDADQVERAGLGLHVAGLQRTEAGHDLGPGHGADELDDLGQLGASHDSRSNRARSAGSIRTWTWTPSSSSRRSSTSPCSYSQAMRAPSLSGRR